MYGTNYNKEKNMFDYGTLEEYQQDQVPQYTPQVSAAPAQVAPADSKASDIGDKVTMAGGATGNPYLIGTGLGLQTMGMIQQGKQN